MSAAAKPYQLKKVETRARPGCVATYAVVIDGEVRGHIDKYVHEEVTRVGGQRSGRSTRTAMYTTWGYRRPGTLEVPPGCILRRDAINRFFLTLKEDS